MESTSSGARHALLATSPVELRESKSQAVHQSKPSPNASDIDNDTADQLMNGSSATDAVDQPTEHDPVVLRSAVAKLMMKEMTRAQLKLDAEGVFGDSDTWINCGNCRPDGECGAVSCCDLCAQTTCLPVCGDEICGCCAAFDHACEVCNKCARCEDCPSAVGRDKPPPLSESASTEASLGFRPEDRRNDDPFFRTDPAIGEPPIGAPPTGFDFESKTPGTVGPRSQIDREGRYLSPELRVRRGPNLQECEGDNCGAPDWASQPLVSSGAPSARSKLLLLSPLRPDDDTIGYEGEGPDWGDGMQYPFGQGMPPQVKDGEMPPPTETSEQETEDGDTTSGMSAHMSFLLQKARRLMKQQRSKKKHMMPGGARPLPMSESGGAAETLRQIDDKLLELRPRRRAARALSILQKLTSSAQFLGTSVSDAASDEEEEELNVTTKGVVPPPTVLTPLASSAAESVASATAAASLPVATTTIGTSVEQTRPPAIRISLQQQQQQQQQQQRNEHGQEYANVPDAKTPQVGSDSLPSSSLYSVNSPSIDRSVLPSISSAATKKGLRVTIRAPAGAPLDPLGIGALQSCTGFAVDLNDLELSRYRHGQLVVQRNSGQSRSGLTSITMLQRKLLRTPAKVARACAADFPRYVARIPNVATQKVYGNRTEPGGYRVQTDTVHSWAGLGANATTTSLRMALNNHVTDSEVRWALDPNRTSQGDVALNDGCYHFEPVAELEGGVGGEDGATIVSFMSRLSLKHEYGPLTDLVCSAFLHSYNGLGWLALALNDTSATGCHQNASVARDLREEKRMSAAAPLDFVPTAPAAIYVNDLLESRLVTPAAAWRAAMTHPKGLSSIAATLPTNRFNSSSGEPIAGIPAK